MKKIGAAFSVLVLGGLVFWLVNNSGYFPYTHNPLQYMPNMHHTKALIPQRGYDFYADGASVRVPPAGAVAVNQNPYPYTKATFAADVRKFSNPVAADLATVKRGQKVFMTYCVVCHGPKGYGDGYVVPPFSQPPSLQSEKIRGYADSQIFHVITVGQNVMGAYGPQIREQDRWAVIHYLRVLQRAENPNDEDIKAFENVFPPEQETK